MCWKVSSLFVWIARSIAGTQPDLFTSYASRFSSLKSTVTIHWLATPKALWRLSWFLRDFGYNADLLGRDELDEKALLGLQGIVRVSHTVLNGHSFLNFDGFAPAVDWEEFAPARSGIQP
jgi:hypothetical protein